MLTPFRKPQFRSLLDWEKEFNKAVGSIRYKIERAIANLKTWRILHMDYRRPLASFAEQFPLSSAWSSTGSTVNNPRCLIAELVMTQMTIKPTTATAPSSKLASLSSLRPLSPYQR
jgi:DDE superfamily endonuclease